MVSYLMSTEDRWNNFKGNLLFNVWLCNVWIWIVQCLLWIMHTWWWCERQKKTGTETSTHGDSSKIIVYSIIASLYVGGEAEDGPLIFSNQRPSWFGSAAWNRYSAPLANLKIYRFLKKMKKYPRSQNSPQPWDIFSLGIVDRHLCRAAVEVEDRLAFNETVFLEESRLCVEERDLPPS